MANRSFRLVPAVVAGLLVASLGSPRTVRADGSEVNDIRAEGLSLGNLARLAQLERMSGNGGAEEPQEAAVLSGYDKKHGFYVRDKTGDNLLRLGVQLQIRHSFFAKEVRGSSVDSGEAGKADDVAFELERARFVAQGNVLTKELTYKFQADGDSDGSGAWKSLDAYVEYWAGGILAGPGNEGALAIGVGQFKPYFMRQESASSAVLQMVDRNLTNEFFNIDRNLGAWIRGDLGDVKGDAPSVYYAFAVTNGFDSVNVRPGLVDNIPAFVGKLDFQLWGDKVEKGKYEEGNVGRKSLFSLGVSAATDENNNSSGVGGPKVKIYQFGIDTVFKYEALSLQSEYVGRWVDYENGNGAIPGGAGDAQYAHGWYVQGGVMVTDDVELTGRAAFVWGDGQQKGNGMEAGPGINWYISGDHKIKLQTDVAWVDISRNVADSSEDLDGSLGTTGAGTTTSSFESSAAGIAAGEQGLLWRTQLQLSF